MKKIQIYLVMIFVTFLALPLNHTDLTEVRAAAGTCTWTPTDVEPGEILTINYDATDGPLAGMTDVEMLWYMDVFPNKFGAPPSQNMWPTGTTLLSLLSARDVSTPMVDLGSNQWELQITPNRIFDSLTIYFKSGSTYDRNDNSYWNIDSALKDERIEAFTPAFVAPLFVKPGEAYHFYVNATETATNWQVQITNKVDSPVNLNPTASYDGTMKLWDLSVTIPSNLELTLYDLKYQATIDGKTRFREEINSLAVIEEFKNNYTFVIIADPQHFRDGSYSENRNIESGNGNVTFMAQELDLINPDFILLLGDVVEWTDELAYLNAKKWYNRYLDVPMFIIPGNHDTFQGTGSNYEYASGIGVYQRIFGQRHFAFTYGTHYFVGGYSGDRTMDPTSISAGRSRDIATIEWQFIQDTLGNVPTGTTAEFFMMHHPLSPNYATTDETVDLRDDILALLNTNDFDYYLHGHMASDWYDDIDNTIHIGTNNAVGVPTEEFDEYLGYRIVEMSGDTMSRFSYGPVKPASYYAASNPPHMVNVTFDSPNDGSVGINTAYLYNGYNHSLNNARVHFILAPPSVGKTYESNGTDTAKYIDNGVFYLESNVDIAAITNITLTIQEIDAPVTTTTTTAADQTTTSTTPSITTTTTIEESTGLDILVFFSSLMILVVFIKKRQR